ncbi:hypothetical protein N0V93_002081 [Gnomoniopsis smithogilvyi]|uniref:F-box domain-containing protein n=1 Tax=Gnomoniopsis smithogilvyi TaxID=1191159 RepID=A0A9W8Z6S1_9PEZI|nr:hypothetical protein N0V93_002081 [Gnomoniopsis smithogilvyi]
MNEATSYSSGTALDALIESEDLVHCVARLIPSRADLRSLCLVSRRWNQTFSQFLYAHILFHDRNARVLRDPALLRTFLANPRVGCAKALSFKLIEGSWAISNHRELDRLTDAQEYGGFGDIQSCAGVYNDSIEKVVSKTPNLVKFEWENWPISQSLLKALEDSCSGLRDVRIVYHNLAKFSSTESLSRNGTSTFDGVKPELIAPPPPAFQNMRKVYLYEITGNLDVWICKIAEILGKSRFLEELGLSLSAECERQYAREDWTQNSMSFFLRLVDRYREHGYDPLRLRVLKLGYGVLLNATHEPRQDGTVEPAEYLSDLTNLTCLEELYFDNDLDIGCSMSLRQTTGHIAWSTVNSPYLPNLRRFTFTSLSERSRDWLSDHPDPNWINQLAIGFGTESLAFSYVEAEGIVKLVEPHFLPGRLERLSDRMSFLRHDPQSPNLPLKCSKILILKPCQSLDFGALSKCPWITTLVLCLEKRATPQVLRRTLEGDKGKFPVTEHLWIRIGMDYPLLRRAVDEQRHLHNFWREIWAELAQVVAESSSCPTKYLKIGHMAWRIVKQNTRSRPSVLEAVDRWDDETEGPSIFRYDDPVRRDRPY